MTNKKEETESVPDGNVFQQLLELKDVVFHIEERPQFFSTPLRVYYSILKEGEHKKVDFDTPKTADDWKDMSNEDKLAIINKAEVEYTWQMISKAQKVDGAVPNEYVLTRDMWNELGDNFPDVRETIIEKMTGGKRKLMESFFGGPTTRHS